MDRREFMKSAALTSAAAAISPALAQPPAAPKTFVGIQMDIGRILSDGIDRVLDDIQRLAHVNALFLYTITYMDERVHARTTVPFRGGNFATVHPQYYKDTLLKPEDTRSPDFPGLDILATVVPAARKRGIKTFCWIIEDNTLPNVPNMDKLWEVGLDGRPATRHPGGPCFNNPNYTNYLLGLVEDYCRSYEVDGIMFGSERQGPLGYSLGAYHNGSRADPATTCCFCSFCESKARRMGIDMARVRQGYLALQKFVRAGRSNQRPIDGYYVAFWRVLPSIPKSSYGSASGPPACRIPTPHSTPKLNPSTPRFSPDGTSGRTPHGTPSTAPSRTSPQWPRSPTTSSPWSTTTALASA